MRANLLNFLCQKSAISYIIFDTAFRIIDTNDSNLNIDSDIRDSLYELVGLEESILALEMQNTPIVLPMLLREGDYYDLEIEAFHEEKDLLFIATLKKRSQHTQEYANVLKEINKKTLIYDLSEEKKESASHKEINKHLITLHIDLDGFITMVNDAALNFFNKERVKLINLHFSELFIPQKSQNSSHSKIFMAKNSANEDIFFHADFIPITNKEGNVIENIIVAQDITHLKRIKKELEYAQEHDTLTGLPNRHHFLKMLDTKKKSFSLCFVDIDSFHTINEEYGAHAADMLLKHFTTLLVEFLDFEDSLIRLNADKFVICFDEEKNNSYIDILQKEVEQLTDKNPLYYNSEDIIHFTVTTLLLRYPDEIENTKELLSIVEKIMQRKKIDKKAK